MPQSAVYLVIALERESVAVDLPAENWRSARQAREYLAASDRCLSVAVVSPIGRDRTMEPHRIVGAYIRFIELGKTSSIAVVSAWIEDGEDSEITRVLSRRESRRSECLMWLTQLRS